MSKVILVLIDGLGHDVAVEEMGHLEGLVQAGRASRRRLSAVLPSVSRPAYESLHTGLAPVHHGITSNLIMRPSTQPNVFALARAGGLSTAAAAYSWFSDLYNGGPYDPVRDREIDDGPGAIQHGRFYYVNDYPDAEVLWQGDRLARTAHPDYLLIHPMGCDHVGHLHGGGSPQQRRVAAGIDDLVAQLLPGWQDLGYRVFVTSDHGMSSHGSHGGTTDDVRHVAFYDLGCERGGIGESGDQLSVAPTILHHLGLERPPTMQAPLLL